MPAAVRGAMAGVSAGLIGGLIGVLVPPIGLTIAGVAATTLVGAAVGSWVTALIGSMVPDEVHRRFESEIRAGRILIVVDETPGTMAAGEAALREAGAEQLPYEAPSALHRLSPRPARQLFDSCHAARPARGRPRAFSSNCAVRARALGRSLLFLAHHRPGISVDLQLHALPPRACGLR